MEIRFTYCWQEKKTSPWVLSPEGKATRVQIDYQGFRCGDFLTREHPPERRVLLCDECARSSGYRW